MTKRSSCINALGFSAFVKTISCHIPFYPRSFPWDLAPDACSGNQLSNDFYVSFPFTFHVALLVCYGIIFWRTTCTQIFVSMCVIMWTQPQAFTTYLFLPQFLISVSSAPPQYQLRRIHINRSWWWSSHMAEFYVVLWVSVLPSSFAFKIYFPCLIALGLAWSSVQCWIRV